MTTDDLKSHIEDILDVLSENAEKKVDREEIEKEFIKFLDYGVPVDQAKQTLIKKFGGGVSFSPQPVSSERTPIADLQPDTPSVNLLCRVIAITEKEITVKGEQRIIFYGIFGDESGTITFTAWNDFKIEKGDVIELSNAYTREWQGATQLNLGDRVTIKKTDAEKLPESAYVPKEYKIKDLRSGLGSVEITARILDITERETEVSGETKKVFSGSIGDETGKAQFTSWHDYKLKQGDVVKISGGYVKSWKGIPQLTFDEKASVKKLDKSKLPKETADWQKLPIYQLVEKRGALDIEIEGTVIEVRPGSGFIMRCPECNRVLINSECTIHGKVTGKPDLRIKMIVDDGTGVVNTTVGKEITEKLLGKTLEDCKKMDEKTLLDEMNSTLFARRISMKGNALGDEFGTTIIAKDANIADVNIKEQAAQLAETLEEMT